MTMKWMIGKAYPVLAFVLAGACFFLQDAAYGQGALYPGVTRGYNGAMPGSATGTLTTCDAVWKTGLGGKSISGGSAGLDAGGGGGGQVCYSGGGQNFCAAMQSSLYNCAGVNIVEGGGVDVDWRAFDISEEEKEDVQQNYYRITTRDATRGRAGYDLPLFMNAHGVCRKVDNTAKKMSPVFMGVISPEEWRTVHGVPAGGNPNGGYSIYANDSIVQVKMSVCCSPVIIQICGSPVQTTYAEVGDVISVWGRNGGHATVQCVANNDWRTIGIDGICGTGGGGGQPGENAGGDGYYNPNTGGVMTTNDFNKLDSGTRQQLEKQGYRDIDQGARPGDKKIMDPPDKVEITDKQAKADAVAAKEAAEAEAKRVEAENKRKEEEAKKAAEAAQKESEEDDDDEEDGM